jgi:cell division transport system permease protein
VKSFKNHLSLVIALLSILFSLQSFIIVQRAIESYKENLAKNYALVIVAKQNIDEKKFLNNYSLVASVEKISADNVIKKLNSGMSKKNMELLKLTLPRFYKLKLKHYPSPAEIESLRTKLLENSYIQKVESFSKTHDTTYKLLLLFKRVITVFAFTVMIVTVLLIFKELRIWQFKHNERMNVMGLFGAPVWLRSAVLFRLAIVDAIIASALAFLIFSYLSTTSWIENEFNNIGITLVFFDKLYDFLLMLGVSVTVSILLAAFIVLGHKEEV